MLATSSALCVHEEGGGPRDCAPLGTAHVLWDLYAQYSSQDSARSVPCDSLVVSSLQSAVLNLTLCLGRGVTIERGLSGVTSIPIRTDSAEDSPVPLLAQWNPDLTVRMLAHDDAGGRLATLNDGSVQHVLPAWYVGDCCLRTQDGCDPAVVEVLHFCNPADADEREKRPFRLTAVRQASEADELHQDRSVQWQGLRRDHSFACQWYAVECVPARAAGVENWGLLAFNVQVR